MVVTLVALLGGFTLFHVLGAARAGERGRAALIRAEASLSARELKIAREHLAEARAAFTETREEMAALGPVASVARRVPVVGDQVKAVDAFAGAGLSLSQSAQQLIDAAESVLQPADDRLPISDAMKALRRTQESLGPAVAALSQASDDVTSLRGRYLIGPLARARDDLATRLPRIHDRARSADQGLTALMTFAGLSGPKRYLFLSQNPDEVRPTGGFIGTYGVLTGDDGHMKLERYDGIDEWVHGRPAASVPADKVGSPFRYHDPPLRQGLANVNSQPDWPTAAKLAADLWIAGGEAPVDGVISFTPGFMRRILSVVGAVTIPSYGETVTASNFDERIDYYTHRVTPLPGADRKDFVAVVAEAVMQKLLEAPASQWESLGRVMGQAFDAREALAWAVDPQVAATLAERKWDGAFPTHDGDFFFNSEFEYVAKNGRGIRRVYDHQVALTPDGGARITTTLTVTNTEPPDPAGNASTLAYMTLYGPQGAVVDQVASDAFGFEEPALAGHPARGWFRAAAPSGGQTTLKVIWDAPGLLTKQGDGTWRYSLRWRNLPDHIGDVVNLNIELPPGWRWTEGAPPAQLSLDQEIIGSWALSSSSGG